MREAIEIKRRQIGDKAVSGLAYFNGCIKDARVRRRLPDAEYARTNYLHVRLPDFTLARLSRATFDEDMLAIEEALTSPAAAD